MGLLAAGPAAAQEAPPSKWEQLFFPFPIVGAPPQLEQQLQLFDSYFTGSHGTADVPSVELGYIATPRLGLVLTVPFQFGFAGQRTGFEDVNVLAQVLAAGSLERDDMVSVGLSTTLPTGPPGIGGGDLYEGFFVYAAQRFFRRLILEGDLTFELPVLSGESQRDVAADGLVSILLTRERSSFPVYAQVEVDSTTSLGSTGATQEAFSVAPELFLGPFPTLVSDGTRVAAGVAFDVSGDPVHARTYTLTIAFDIPNPYGY